MKFLLGALALIPVLASAQTPTTSEMTRQMRHELQRDSERFWQDAADQQRQWDAQFHSDMQHYEQMERLESIERRLNSLDHINRNPNDY